jgi:RimJ/RimL family protein N-acetyltransferase
VVAVTATATAPGLVLRLWAEGDAPALVAAHRDPLLRRWLLHPITSEEQASQVIETRRADARAGKSFSFAVLEQVADGEADCLVGGVSLRRLEPAASAAAASGAGTFDAGTAAAEVGYWVAAPARGRGVAPRALDAACEWALRTLRDPPLGRLELIHSVGNQASCRVAEKTSFTLAAMLPPLPPDFPDNGHLHVRLP